MYLTPHLYANDDALIARNSLIVSQFKLFSKLLTPVKGIQQTKNLLPALLQLTAR